MVQAIVHAALIGDTGLLRAVRRSTGVDVETDYLIVGSGAVGMAFADTLLDESDAHITIVDRRAKPELTNRACGL